MVIDGINNRLTNHLIIGIIIEYGKSTALYKLNLKLITGVQLFFLVDLIWGIFVYYKSIKFIKKRLYILWYGTRSHLFNTISNITYIYNYLGFMSSILDGSIESQRCVNVWNTFEMKHTLRFTCPSRLRTWAETQDKHQVVSTTPDTSTPNTHGYGFENLAYYYWLI